METRATYERVKEALCKRFKPESKQELYSVQFQSKKRQPDEHWADFADNLWVLADRAFPELQEEALIGPVPGGSDKSAGGICSVTEKARDP